MYSTTKAALLTRLGTLVDTSNPERPQLVIGYEPQALSVAPAIYVTLDSFTRAIANQVVVMHYVNRLRYCVLWQDNEHAEEQLEWAVNGIPDVIDQDPYLLGAIDSGFCKVTRGDAGYTAIGGTIYRTVDFMTDTLDKAGWKSGI
jgi:hypothetical protein